MDVFELKISSLLIVSVRRSFSGERSAFNVRSNERGTLVTRVIDQMINFAFACWNVEKEEEKKKNMLTHFPYTRYHIPRNIFHLQCRFVD